jgi:hypothetical protein
MLVVDGLVHEVNYFVGDSEEKPDEKKYPVNKTRPLEFCFHRSLLCSPAGYPQRNIGSRQPKSGVHDKGKLIVEIQGLPKLSIRKA